MNKPQIDTKDILLKSYDYVIANKRAGLLSQASPGEASLQEDLEKYFKRKLHILTRLDRPVSGLVLFSKSNKFTQYFLKAQAAQEVTKEYLAIVEGQWNLKKELFEHYMYPQVRNNKAKVTDKFDEKNRKITLKVFPLKVLDNYSVLRVELYSGAFHQIRAQLAFMGYPIKGDVKYGARRGNKDRSIHLHAYKISFTDLKDQEQAPIAVVPPLDTLRKLGAEALDILESKE